MIKICSLSLQSFQTAKLISKGKHKALHSKRICSIKCKYPQAIVRFMCMDMCTLNNLIYKDFLSFTDDQKIYVSCCFCFYIHLKKQNYHMYFLHILVFNVRNYILL